MFENSPAIVKIRNKLTDVSLSRSPYNPELWYRRAEAHNDLGYPDLAIGDCYRALLLVDELLEFEEGSEFGELGVAQWRQLRAKEEVAGRADKDDAESKDVEAEEEDEVDDEDEEDQPPLTDLEKTSLDLLALFSRRMLCTSLIKIGCLLDAQEQAAQALKFHPNDGELTRTHEKATELIEQRRKDDPDVSDFALRRGEVARVIYPWNTHEPDRTSKETVSFLDKIVKEASMGNFTVKVTKLPVLVPDTKSEEKDKLRLETVKQLGVYAAKNLPADTIVFRERSILTVNNRLHDTLCDCCSGRLPDSTEECFSCPECSEVAFCSQLCLDEAMDKYHSALCGQDLDFLFKSSHSGFQSASSNDTTVSTSSNAASSLYTLLLLKALAMSLTQDVNILDILPIKYLYGSSPPPPPPAKPPTLPFTFSDNILSVFHLLTRLEVDPYVVSLEKFDIWHTLTIHSKILGTASARHDVKSGAPEVAALHLCYSLVNHDCSPCLKWECKSSMEFTTLRDIKEGEEVRDSYTDIRLGWKDRREWLMGTLGGGCRCDRCAKEEAEDLEKEEGGA